MGALERRRPRPLTIARTPTTATTTTTTTTAAAATIANTRAADDDEGVATVGGRCGGGGGKSAARIAVERALGGAFDYKSVARDAVDGARDVRVSSSARGDDDGDDDSGGWRSFASDDARAFAAETRREVERRIRAIDGEIERAARARRRDNHMFDGNRDDGDDDKDARKVVKSRYLEAVNARREEFAKLHRAKTSVAFGSTIRA